MTRLFRGERLREPRVLILVIYLGLTALSLIALAGLLAIRGIDGFFLIQSEGHVSSLGLNFAVFCLSWLLAGLAIASLHFSGLVTRHAAFCIVLALIAFSYLNTTRESHYSEGDFSAYYNAAECVSKRVPIVQREGNLYLYPPLLATVLSPLAGFGPGKMMQGFRLSNYFAVLLLAILLYRALQRYRFSRELSALAVLIILTANVPVARTLLYNQINIHVLNLILLSLILFARHPFWSALSLALATHLKVSPVVLAMPFLIWRQWRWCLYFALSNLLIVGGTSAVAGFDYYVAFFNDVSRISETALRNASVDSFVFNTFRYLQWGAAIPRAVVAHALRLSLTASLLFSYWKTGSRATLTDSADASNRGILNGYVLLPILMVSIAPSIWPHHLVFLMLTLPVLFTALRTQWDFYLYLVAYFGIILLPVFDIYPFSYLRLVGLVILLVLFGRSARRDADRAPDWLITLRDALRTAGARIVAGGHTQAG